MTYTILFDLDLLLSLSLSVNFGLKPEFPLIRERLSQKVKSPTASQVQSG